jgi:hypothetical protein
VRSVKMGWKTIRGRSKTVMASKKSAEKDIVVSASAPARKRIVRRVTRAVAPLETASQPAAPKADAPASAGGPSWDDVARLAYSYWEARGCQGGSPEEDWARAERELRPLVSLATA